jgi:superfamily I DNA and/or RNA helicase
VLYDRVSAGPDSPVFHGQIGDAGKIDGVSRQNGQIYRLGNRSDAQVHGSDPHAAPAEFIDTAGAGFDEEPEPDGESRLNPSEAEFVAAKVRQLLDVGVEAQQIAVIAPYAAQVRRLRRLLPIDGLEIDSVDGFQGREKEAVVIGLVRSNALGEVGFLSDVRRMNVALTRARRKLIVVGDSATLAGHPFYRRMVDYFESVGGYRTIWQEDGWA